jgi:hypothetical protein
MRRTRRVWQARKRMERKPPFTYEDRGDHYEVEHDTPEGTIVQRIPKTSNTNEDWARRITTAGRLLNCGEVA